MSLLFTRVSRWLCVALTAVGLRAQAQGPALTAQQPVRNAVAAPRNSPLTLTFTQAVSAASAPNLRVYGSQLRGRRPGTLTGGGTTTLTFAPAQAFAPGEQVSVTVPATLTSLSGVAAPAQVFQFTAAVGGSGPGLFLDTTVVGRTSSRDQLLGDLDNDGDLDLVSSAALFGMSTYLNNGTGGFRPLGSVVMGATPSGAALGDFNQDGYLDLVAGDADNATVALAMGTGTGEFGLMGFPSQTVAVGGTVAGVAVGDVDGDGDLDFVSANSGNSTASVGLNDGTGRIGTVRSMTVGIQPSAIRLGDIDNDGDLDLLTSDKGGFSVSILLNNGRGTFGNLSSLSVGFNPTDLVLADLDGDGDLDLVTANAGGSSLSLFWNSGGSFPNGLTIPLTTGSTPTGLSAGDVDADGDLDLVVAHGTGGRLTTFRNSGNGTLTAQPSVLTLAGFASQPGQSLGVTLGDVDGDLDLDVITAEGNTARVVLARNGAAPTLTSFSPGSGVPGDVLTLTGTNLTSTRRIRFGGSAGNEVSSGFSVNAAGTQISGVVVPPGAGSGPISLTTGAGTVQSAGSFVVNAAQLVVLQAGTALPPAGAGYDFGALAQGSTSAPVTFTLSNPGGQPLTISSISATGPFVLSGSTPGSVAPGATATVAVRFQPTTTGALTGSLLISSNAAGYPSYAVTLRGTGLVPVPQITSFSPSSVPQGTLLTINGTNLLNASAITFSGFVDVVVRSGFTVNAAGTQVEVEVPLDASTGPVTVTTPVGTSAARQLTVLPAPPPTITSISPNNGPVGTPLTITGTHLLGAIGLRFDSSVLTQIRVVNSTTITALFPGFGNSFTPQVSVQTPSGVSNALPFRATPVLVRTAPRVPAPGAQVTLTCHSCSNATSLLFNGTALPYRVDSGDIIFTAPAAATGPLQVVTPNGTSNALTLSVGAQPLLSSITPSTGAAGATVSLRGTNLHGASIITFAGPGQNTVTSGFTVNAAGTQISGVVVPPGAGTGWVQVTTPLGITEVGVTFTASSTPAPAAPAWSGLLAPGGYGSVLATASDASGNIYMAGEFVGQLRLGTTVLNTNSTSTHQGFVAKWNRATNDYAWALQVEGWGSVMRALVVQGGNVYVGGTFNRSGFFGPFAFPNQPTSEAFVAKITDRGTSASYTWVEISTGPCIETVTNLVWQNGSLYAAGTFGDEVYQSQDGVFGAFTLHGQGRGDVFVAKLSDLGSAGRYEWAVAAGGSGPDAPRALSVNGNRIYVSGGFNGVDFRVGSTVLSAPYDYNYAGYATDGFVAQLVEQGNTAAFTWVRQLRGNGNDYISGVAAQGADVYISGQYQDEATLGTQRFDSPTAQGGNHVLVAKLTDAGALVWAQPIRQLGNSYTGLNTGGIAVSGTQLFTTFAAPAAMQCGPFGLPRGDYHCRVVKLLDQGNSPQVRWVQGASGPGGGSMGSALHVQGANVYLGGYVENRVSFGPFTASNNGSYYPFVASITDMVLNTRPAAARAALSLYPNPAHHSVTVEVPGTGAAATGSVSLLDALGRVVRHQPLAVSAAGRRQELALAGLPAGVYVVRVVAGELTATGRLVVE